MKKSKPQSGYSSGNTEFSVINNSGQAVIEYVLMLIISVSLILTLVTQIFKPMEKYMQAFMGDYVQCLLETGALPSFGGDSVPNAQDMGCVMPNFQDVAGKMGDGKGSNGGRNSGSKSEEGDGAGGSKNSSSSGSAESGSGSNRGSGYAGSASRGGGGVVRSPKRIQSGIESSENSKGKVVEVALEGGGSGSFFKTGSGRGYAIDNRRKNMAVGIAGLNEADKKKLEKKKESTRTIAVSTGDFGPPPKKIGVKKPEIKQEIKDDSEPMTVGNFIRYLFIAALIIALVIFVGGQVVSMSDGRDS